MLGCSLSRSELFETESLLKAGYSLSRYSSSTGFTVNKVSYLLSEQRLWKLSMILIAEPHLSELEFSGHIVTVGKATFSIEWANVSTIVMVGTSAHALIGKKRR